MCGSELIGEDGKDPTIIPRLPRAYMTKIDVAPTLGLRDSDLVFLAKEILENKVCIKTNVAYRDRLTLAQWCKEKKLDRVIMNELIRKHRQYKLPSKDQGCHADVFGRTDGQTIRRGPWGRL
jgi:hypothetical protein